MQFNLPGCDDLADLALSPRIVVRKVLNLQTIDTGHLPLDLYASLAMLPSLSLKTYIEASSANESPTAVIPILARILP